MLLRGKLFAGALFAGALFGPVDAAVEPPVTAVAGAGGGSGGFMRAINLDLAEEFEKISREGEKAARQARQFKPAPLVEAVSRTIEQPNESARMAEADRLAAMQSVARAKLKESELLAQQAIEKAKTDSINDYNALMMALVLLDDE